MHGQVSLYSIADLNVGHCVDLTIFERIVFDETLNNVIKYSANSVNCRNMDFYGYNFLKLIKLNKIIEIYQREIINYQNTQKFFLKIAIA